MAKRTLAKGRDAQELTRLMERAESGEKAAMQQLEVYYKAMPAVFEVNAARQALLALIDNTYGADNLYSRFLARRDLRAMRLELEGPHATTLERLLVERVVYTYAVLMCYERALSACANTTFAKAEFLQRRVDAAHRRYLMSIKALAQVRKLQIPTLVQVNIDQRGGSPD